MLILASRSPRRRELLTMAGLDHICIPADIEESVPADTPLPKIPELLAYQKAAAVAADHPSDIVLGSDTIVTIDGLVLGKPKDPDDAFRMLKLLSGRTHTVHTGVAIVSGGRTETFTSSTQVEFYEHDDDSLRRYIASGDPMDKAGAYGIQGAGAFLVRKIDGDYYAVMGLPIAEIVRRFRGFCQE